jgi:GNAT superfamily N-acetyltransferase
MLVVMKDTEIKWRQAFTNTEANRLHAVAFHTRRYSDQEWDWVAQVGEHSLGWVTARLDDELIGFANVISDGFVHAWLQDVMVSPDHQQSGVGSRMVDLATQQCRATGCEWLHVDFDDDVADFYYRRCGFRPTSAGLLYLQ